MRERGGRRPKKEMQKLKESALSLIRVNPRLSMNRIADHVGVSRMTVSKWFEEAKLKRWF